MSNLFENHCKYIGLTSFNISKLNQQLQTIQYIEKDSVNIILEKYPKKISGTYWKYVTNTSTRNKSLIYCSNYAYIFEIIANTFKIYSSNMLILK